MGDDGGRLPKEKKTWVTDVNVYSKKKKMDEIAELFGDDSGDESDAMDEFGKYFLPPLYFETRPSFNF